MEGREIRRPRRSPASHERRRDAERTKRKLLDAALVEFSEHGRSGARVSAIAARAGVDKQLISYYFGGKDGLYHALVERWLAAEREFAAPDLPLDELVARHVIDGAKDRELARLLARASMEDDAPGDRPPDQGTVQAVADLRQRQQAGEIADDLDPAYLLLLLQGAAAAGVIFPGDARQATGLDASSPEFAERYAEQLRRVVRRLAAPANPSSSR